MRPSFASFAALGVSLACFGTAAPAFAAPPTVPECLAATESALKLRTEHKLRGARRALLTCAAPSCPSDVRADCTRAVEELNAQIPTIIFGAKDATGADVSAVTVTMDGEVLSEQIDGAPLSVDPGTHTFTFDSVGRPPVTKTLTVLQSQKDRRETVTFGRAGAVPVAPVGPVTVPILSAPSPQETTAPSGGLGGQKIGGIVVAVAGVGGLALGSVFAVLTGNAISAQKADCASTKVCPDRGGANSEHSTWTTDSTISTAAFIAGGVLVAGGAALFFTAHAPARGGGTSFVVVPSAMPGGGAMLLQGEF